MGIDTLVVHTKSVSTGTEEAMAHLNETREKKYGVQDEPPSLQIPSPAKAQII